MRCRRPSHARAASPGGPRWSRGRRGWRDRRRTSDRPPAERNRREPGDIVPEVRPFGMPRDLRFLPRRQLGIGVAQQLGRLGFQLADLRIEVELAGVRRFLSSETRVSSSAIGFSKSRYVCIGRRGTVERSATSTTVARAGGGCSPARSAGRYRRACRFAWSRYRHARAATGRREGLRRPTADASRTRGAGRAG